MKIRLSIRMVIIFTMALIIYQNHDFYLDEQTLSLNFFSVKLEMPPFANATQILLCFSAGIILACASLYHDQIQLLRENKNFDAAFHSYANRVTTMKSTECTQPRKKLFKLTGKLRSKNDEAVTEPPTTNGSDTLPD